MKKEALAIKENLLPFLGSTKFYKNIFSPLSNTLVFS